MFQFNIVFGILVAFASNAALARIGENAWRWMLGVAAFQAMLDSLAEGQSVALSADVPKVARIAGLGIIKLAQASGRPIYPSAIATSRRIVLNNLDRTTINLPFGRGAGVAAEPLTVPRDADDDALERARRQLEDRLNAATRRAYEIVDAG